MCRIDEPWAKNKLWVLPVDGPVRWWCWNTGDGGSSERLAFRWDQSTTYVRVRSVRIKRTSNICGSPHSIAGTGKKQNALKISLDLFLTHTNHLGLCCEGLDCGICACKRRRRARKTMVKRNMHNSAFVATLMHTLWFVIRYNDGMGMNKINTIKDIIKAVEHLHNAGQSYFKGVDWHMILYI